MLAPFIGLLLAATDVPSRTVVVALGANTRVRIECPKGQMTRIVLPERLRRLTSSPSGARLALGLRVEQSSPMGVIVVLPRDHPYVGELEVVGATAPLKLELKTTAVGAASEVRIQVAAPQAASPTVPPLASPAATSARPTPTADVGTASPAPTTAVEPTAAGSIGSSDASAESLVDRAALAKAEVQQIDRREGQPGQRVCVLEDVLRDDTHAWFRFRLLGGAADRLSGVESGGVDVRDYVTEVDGKDLRMIVQIRRTEAKGSRMTLRFAGGAAYKFSLSRNTIFNSFFGR